MAKKKTPFHTWENPKDIDGYVRLGFSLINHPKFQNLSGNAIKLYIYMREWAYRKEKSNGQFLTYTLKLAKDIMNVSEPTANKAILELERNGFIIRLNNSKYNKEATRWQFVSDWYKKV